MNLQHVRELLLYTSGSSEYLETAARLSEITDRDELRKQYTSLIHSLIDMAETCGFSGNLWHCALTYVLVSHENAYSRSCEIRGGAEGGVNAAAIHDLVIFQEMFTEDFREIEERTGARMYGLISEYTCREGDQRKFGRRIRTRISKLSEELYLSPDVMQFKENLELFYRDFGVGRFGLHKAFRVRSGESGAVIEPIENIAKVSLDDLVGYEIAKKKLIDNTEAFVAGRKANNCLLFGDAGTGKSSSIKGILNKYYERGLRIIELYKHQFRDLNDVIAQIKNRNYKFIIYMDDLSFEEFETEYKYLKAVIEGGLEKKPDNILIYATSNRRHLIRENYSDKEDIRQDMHTSDTVQEKLSLVHRFGVTIYFGSPDKKEFQNIVRVLAQRAGIRMPEDQLLLEANAWELQHGGLSGRTAQQFIDYLLGMERLQ